MQRKAKSLPGAYLGIVVSASGMFWARAATADAAAVESAAAARRGVGHLLKAGAGPLAWGVRTFFLGDGCRAWEYDDWTRRVTVQRGDGSVDEIDSDPWREVMA